MTRAARRGLAIGSVVIVLMGAVRAAEPQVTSPVLDARVSWLGNTYPGARRWVPQDIDALCVAPDGTLFSNVHWEEGGGNVTAFQDGQVLGPAMHTHGWGNQGGYAVAANAAHLFIAGRMGNEGGGLKDPETWPPRGCDWIGVSRRPLADIRQAAPFDGGKGGRGDTLKHAFLVVDEVPVEQKARDDRRANITGLAATPERLWVSCPYDGTIKVFDAATMQRLAVWPVERAGALALDANGALWVLQDGDATNRPQVLAFDPQGHRLPGHVAFDAAADPAAICFAPDGRLLVADDGPRQQVLIFGVVGGPAAGVRPAPSASTLGLEGGIYAGRPGEFGALKFNRPRAIACDNRGTVFVAHHGSTGGGSTILESYTLAGQLQWRLFGQTFVDMADVDPAEDSQVFTKEERFELDYRQPPGKEWAYRGYTVHRFLYPDDPRLHIWSAGVWVRQIAGRRFLFVNDMNGEQLQVYRWGDESRGEIALPSGLFAKRRLNQDGWPPHQPERGAWIWRDGNGSGAFEAGEFTTHDGTDAPPSQGWWVDAQGGVWLASETQGIRYFPLQGLDPHGNPRWDFASVRSFPHPAGFQQLKRLRYDPSADRMYLGGTTEEHKNQHWKPMGPVLACYDGWVKTAGRTEPRWQCLAPYERGSQGHSSCEPMGFDVAGEYLFVPYTGASKSLQFKTGHVEVFRAADGRSVGHFEPSPDIGEIGLQDIRECLRAHRRADGEYLVFLEDDYKAKVLLYRWRP